MIFGITSFVFLWFSLWETFILIRLTILTSKLSKYAPIISICLIKSLQTIAKARKIFKDFHYSVDIKISV